MQTGKLEKGQVPHSKGPQGRANMGEEGKKSNNRDKPQPTKKAMCEELEKRCRQGGTGDLGGS